MGGPRLEARFAGLGSGWKTPPFIPKMLREYGYEPDLYICDRQQRLGVVCLDNNAHLRPTVVGDMQQLPFKEDSFRCAFYDPPYDAPYKRAVQELGRVCQEKIAVLHIRDVGPPRRSGVDTDGKNIWKREASILLLCGNDAQIRCLNLFKKLLPEQLPLEAML